METAISGSGVPLVALKAKHLEGLNYAASRV
jgi:hypothetical protein